MRNKQRSWLTKRQVTICILIVVLSFGSIGVVRYNTFVMMATASSTFTLPTSQQATSSLAWPNYGQAAIAVESDTVLARHGLQKPQPTASTAKVITMLAVMKKKPFTVDTEGATLTLTPNDVALYNYYIANNGSNVRVAAGEKITQYQAMQGVLLASSNNLADSLAIWAFGSLEAYRAYATELLKTYGLTQTTIGTDASGLSPTTTSTADDLAIIGLRAMEDPIIAKIIASSQATIPVAGTIYNTNKLLRYDDIVGVKTGETVEAGGVFILGGVREFDGKDYPIAVAVMGAELGSIAQRDSYALYESTKGQLVYQTIVSKGQKVGAYHTKWSDNEYPVTASRDLVVPRLLNENLTYKIDMQQLSAGDGGFVGTLTTSAGGKTYDTLLQLNSPIAKPSLWQRLFE